MNASSAGIITNVGATVTIQNNPLFDVGFACGWVGGYLQTWNSKYIGTARGPHAWLDANTIANTMGINPDVHYPGDSPAYIGRGSMYA